MTEPGDVERGSGDYLRQESEAHQARPQLGRAGPGIARRSGPACKFLFAFLLSIAFQARFASTTGFQRDDYLVTLMLSGAAAAIFIAPVAIHRLLFRFRVKDEVVNVTNVLALGGLASLSLALVGSILLVSDWVAGSLGAGICTGITAFLLLGGWFVFPIWLRRRAEAASSSARSGAQASAGPSD